MTRLRLVVTRAVLALCPSEGAKLGGREPRARSACEALLAAAATAAAAKRVRPRTAFSPCAAPTQDRGGKAVARGPLGGRELGRRGTESGSTSSSQGEALEKHILGNS